MLIDCPSCARSYNISRGAVGEEGRHVVCPLCQTRWFVAARDETPEVETLNADIRENADSPEVDEIHARATPRAAASDMRADVRDSLAHPPRYRTRRAPPPARTGGFRGLAAALACLVLAMGLIGKREAIVRAAPRAAALYNAIGLPVNIRGVIFAEVKTTRTAEAEGGIEISGVIRNVTRARTRVPSLSFEIRDDKGATLARWSEGAPKRVIANNETVAFASQFPSLPPGSRDVMVRFGDDESNTTAPPVTVVRAGR
jgi:predicted Zn finger-like uncharacterized protein